jgi:CheY-like chemotaxis protein
MTIMIDLPPEAEEKLRAAAEAQGKDVNAFAVAAITEAVQHAYRDEFSKAKSRDDTEFNFVPSRTDTKPKTGAELIARLESKGVLTGFGDPAIDSLELARQIRERAQTREWDPSLFPIFHEETK